MGKNYYFSYTACCFLAVNTPPGVASRIAVPRFGDSKLMRLRRRIRNNTVANFCP
jgi:hypothetical protein